MTIQEIKRQAQPEVVACLEKLLKRAQAGEILSVAAAYVDSSAHLGSYSYWSRRKDNLILLGALELCKDSVKRGISLSERHEKE